MRSPLSFAAGDLEWESRVVAAHHKLAVMERRMLAGDRDETELWKRYDREFHQTLIEACGSQTLLDLYAGVFDQYLRYQMVAVVFRGEIAAEEHRLLLDCALARDAVARLRGARPPCERLRGAHARKRRLCDERTARRAGRRRRSAKAAYRASAPTSSSAGLPPGRKLKLDRLQGRLRRERQHAARDSEPPPAPSGSCVAEGQKGFEVAPVSIAT